MKTLIVYMSTHGCTAKAASEMKEKLGNQVTVINLKKDKIPLLNSFERIIIGGSIHAGQIQKRVKEFCISNLDSLLNRELGLFICCMHECETAIQQLKNAYAEELLNHAKATAILGGAYDFERMNFIKRMIVKKVAKVNTSVDNINHSAMDKFVNRLDKVFNPFLFLA
ncbi:MAG: flavodoxin [Mariniphaga sp.]|nr:flavodoxin [Mariniphaga sp.]